MYSVNGTNFSIYSQAVKAAKSLRANVIDTRTSRVVWAPAPIPKARRVEHLLVNFDGSVSPFGKVRN